MSTISKNDFIAGVKKSGVIENQQLDDWLKTVDAETTQEIAAKLIRDQLLTKWQAKYLMSGRTRLDVGSYRLLERIQRDELGDRFLALHMSLARKVNLLVLPSELTKDKPRCDAFMQKSSLVAKLDHPNLTHVYDIDREGGRLFLVTEHIEGTALDKVDRTQLNESAIAQFVVQVIAGIRHAHDNHVIHGCISQTDLVLTIDDEVKIQNLSVSPIRLKQSDVGAMPAAADDYAAISEISVALLNEIPEHERSPGFESLAAMFADVNPADPDSIESLSESLIRWLESNDGLVTGEPLDLIEADPLAGGFDQPIATTSAPPKKKPPKEEPQEPIDLEKQPGVVGRLWKENPVAVIATAGVIVIMLIGGTAWGVSSLLNQSDTPANVARNNSRMSTNANDPTSGAGKSGTANTNEVSLKPPDFKDVAGMEKLIDSLPVEPGPGLSNQSAAPAKNNQPAAPPANAPAKTTPDNTAAAAAPDQPAAAPNQPVTTPGTEVAVKGNPMGNASNVAANPEPEVKPPTSEVLVNKVPLADATAPDVLTKISGIGEATQTVLFKNGVTTFQQLAAMNPDQLKEVLKQANFLRQSQKHADWIAQAKNLTGDASAVSTTTSAAPGTTPAPAETAGPFANFPRLTDLPPTNNKQEVKLADLVIKKQYLLGAEIFCEPGVARTKLIFELRRSSDDKQKWIVGVKRREKEKPTDIAYFRKSENAFHFQWLPEAEKNKYANYLRNCFLKLKLPDDQAAFLTLRQPVRIPDLRLTQDSLTNEIEVDLPWLPHPDNVIIEVLPLRIQGVQSTVAQSAIEKGMPGIIWLKRQDKTGFMWLQVGAEMRSKLKLQSNLVLLSKPVKSLKELSDFAAMIKQKELQAVTLNQQAQAQKAPPNKKAEYDKRKQEFQKQANEAKTMSVKMAEYAEVLPKILNQPVSVRIYAKLGNFQTILAVTDPKLHETKAGEKK